MLEDDDDLDRSRSDHNAMRFTSLPRTVRLRIYHSILSTNVRDFLGPSTAAAFLEAFKHVPPIKNELDTEAMRTWTLGITYDTS